MAKYLSPIRPFIPFSFSQFWLMNKKSLFCTCCVAMIPFYFQLFRTTAQRENRRLFSRTTQRRFTTTWWHGRWNIRGIYQQLFENTYIFLKAATFSLSAQRQLLILDKDNQICLLGRLLWQIHKDRMPLTLFGSPGKHVRSLLQNEQ